MQLVEIPFQSRIVETLLHHKDFIFGTLTHTAGVIFPYCGECVCMIKYVFLIVLCLMHAIYCEGGCTDIHLFTVIRFYVSPGVPQNRNPGKTLNLII